MPRLQILIPTQGYKSGISLSILVKEKHLTLA